MAAGIAGSVTTAALAVLGVTGAIVTYVASNYRHLGLFYALAGASALLMVRGVWKGARGIAQIANNGYRGSWSPQTKSHLFDQQAFATLLGLLALGAAVIVGLASPQQPPKTPIVKIVPAGLDQLRARIARDEARIARVEAVLQRLIRQLDGMRDP